jgi:hypothetical protein
MNLFLLIAAWVVSCIVVRVGAMAQSASGEEA